MSSSAISLIREAGGSFDRQGEVRRDYAALDGWRGICAILVALLHFPLASHISSNALVSNSHLFVDFFFVLSGFVLSHAYLGRLGGVADAQFMMWRRLGRLWPLHVAILGAFIALELMLGLTVAVTGYTRSAVGAFDSSTGAAIAAIPTNILLMQGMGVHDRLTWNEPSWSVSVEFWVAMVFAGAVVLGRRRITPIAVVLATIGAVVVIMSSTKFMAVTYDLGFFRCLYGFFTGYLAYRLVQVAPLRGETAKALEVVVAISVFAFVACLSGTAFEFAAPIVFAGCVWVFAGENGVVSKLLMKRPLQLLGLWSYSIYMVHSLIIAVLDRGGGLVAKVVPDLRNFAEAGNPYVMDVMAIGYLAAVIGVSCLAWRWIEMPAQLYWNGPLWCRVVGEQDFASGVAKRRPDVMAAEKA